MSDVYGIPGDNMAKTLFEKYSRTLTEDYVEAPLAVDMDYMCLTSRVLLTDTGRREQPFHIPRNSESYTTVWINLKTNMFRVTTNTKPYTEGIKDIQQRVRIRLDFVINASDQEIKFRPVDVTYLNTSDQMSISLIRYRFGGV